jgi:tellurite methyltransferase
MNRDWQNYFKLTAQRPPSKLLVEALPFVKDRGEALDLGAGSLRDSRFLLVQGFQRVVAVDKELLPPEILNTISSEKFQYIHTDFNSYTFQPGQFDLINAQYSLPFNGAEYFERLINNIKHALKENGIFVGQLFGDRDEWNGSSNDLVFHTKKEAKALISDMQIIHFTEEERDGKTAEGTPKHWHVFNFIIKK